MEILQLRYFFESAKTESFARTAEKYMVPTSSVSASVKRLENELGCQLFDRSSNRIILNGNGKKLQQSLCTVFGELDKVVDELAVEEDDREIKMLVRAMRSNITDYIIEYNQKHPSVAFKTVFDFSEKDFEKYDIIIDEETEAYVDYDKYELSSMRIRMQVSTKSPLYGRQVLLKQLCNQPFVSLGEECNMHRIMVKECNKAGFTPNIAVVSNDIKCYEKLIVSGLGIGLGREDAKKDALPDIGYLDITDFDERYTVYCYYKKQAAYGNVEHFLNFLKSKAV